MPTTKDLKTEVILYQQKALLMANELIANSGIGSMELQQLMAQHVQSTEQDRVIILLKTLDFVNGILGTVATSTDPSEIKNAVNEVLKNIARVQCAIQPNSTTTEQS